MPLQSQPETGKLRAERPTLSLRPAEPRDAGAIAVLIVALWESELPALVAGGRASAREFMRRQLEAESGLRLRNYHVAECEHEVVAIAALSTGSDRRPGFFRKDIVRDLVGLFGVAGTIKLIPAVLRNIASQLPENDPEMSYVYHFVVQPGWQRAHHGEQFARYLEREASRNGCFLLGGQVIDEAVLGFWFRMGATDAGPLPQGRIAKLIGTPSRLVVKRLPVMKGSADGS